MNTRSLIVVGLIIITGCTSSLRSSPTKPTILSSPTIFPTHTTIPSSTPIPFPTSTPSITPIASITPQPGFEIWDAGSVVGRHTVQFPEDKWTENGTILRHKTLQLCSIELYGGSDVCMSGGCTETGLILGDAGFTKTMLGKSSAIYVSRAVRSWISYQINGFEEEQPGRCIQEGEEVLATIVLRPERGCFDRAELVKDIPVPDPSIPTGSTFTKTWRIKNVGTCIWSHKYSFYLVGRVPGADFYHKLDLPSVVYPNQTVDISVELTAPSIEGIARWEWMLQNEFEDQFGVGERLYTQMPGDPLWVQINVVPATTP